MERWVAIILGLLVIVVGFLVVQDLQEGTTSIGDTGNDIECTVNGGTCVQAGECTGEELDHTCGGQRTCCANS